MNLTTEDPLAVRALDRFARMRCVELGRPAVNPTIARFFQQNASAWSSMVNGGVELDLTTLQNLLREWDKGNIGGILLEQEAESWSCTFVEGASSFTPYTVFVPPEIPEPVEEPKKSLFSPLVEPEPEPGVLVDRVIPRALNLIGKRYLERNKLEVSPYDLGRLFGETEHLWVRFTEKGEPYVRAHVHRWLTAWTNRTGISIQVLERKPGEYELSKTDNRHSVFVPYRHETERTPFVAWRPPGLELVGSGALRIVYRLDDNHVLKVPRNVKGIMANRREAEMYLDEVDRYKKAGLDMRLVEFAQCELVSVEGVEDLLMMEWVDKSRHSHKRQKHLRQGERGQFGLTEDGRTVRFDYGG